MNGTQIRLLFMLKDVTSVLDAHGITYHLGYGSALGAVRHNGFIPWDNDIDIAVRDSDLPEVNKVLSEELGDRYYYHIPRADAYPHVVYRTEDFEQDLKDRKAPFIDIFPLKKYPSTRVRQALSFFTIWGIHTAVDMMDSLRSMKVYRHLFWLPRPFFKLSEMLADDDSGFCIVYVTTFRREVMRASWFGTPVKHVFEDIEANMPERCDEVLTKLYGDYVTPPPEDKRSGAAAYPPSIFKDYLLDREEHRVRALCRQVI